MHRNSHGVLANNSSPNLQGVPPAWHTAPVQPSIERTFDGLKPWEDMVRSRAAFSITVLFAVPSDVVAKLQKRYGAAFEKLESLFGARIELGSSVWKESDDGESRIQLTSFAASGAFGEVKKVRETLWSYWEANYWEKAEKTPLPRLQTASVEKADRSPHFPRWAKEVPVSALTRPPNGLTPWARPILRQQMSEDLVLAEIVVPDGDYERIIQVASLEALKERSGLVSVASSEPFRRPNPASTGGEGTDQLQRLLVRSLHVSGSPRRIQLFLDCVTTIKNTHIDNRAAGDLSVTSDSLTNPSQSVPTQSISSQPISSNATSQPVLSKATLQPISSNTTSKPISPTTPSQPIPSSNPSQPLVTRTIFIPDADGKGRTWGWIVGKDGHKLLKIQEKSGCGLPPDPLRHYMPGYFMLQGTEEAVETAKAMFQTNLDQACRSIRMERVEVQEVLPRATANHSESSGSVDDELCYLKLGIPPHPTRGRSFVAFIVGGGAQNLQRFRDRLGCVVWSKDQNVMFKGRRADLVRVRKIIEQMMTHACEKSGIERPDVKEVVPLMSVEEIRKVAPSVAVEMDAYDRNANGEEAKQREDSKSKEFFIVNIRIPPHPDHSRSLKKSVVGARLANLVAARERTGARLQYSSHNGKMMIRGRREQVEHAKELMQQRLTEACEREGIEQLHLIEVAAPAKVGGVVGAVQGRDMQEDDAGDDQDPEQTARAEILADDLKLTLRTLTHPVVLVTSSKITRPGTYSDTLINCHGVTVSSFNTISLSPNPTLLFNLRVPSRTLDAISSSKLLCVHILAASPQGAALAHAFTQAYDDPAEPFRRVKRLGGSVHVTKVTNRGYSKPPNIYLSGGVVARIQAWVVPDKFVEVGDHVIVIAQVKKVEPESIGVEDWRKVLEERKGLAYARRGYRGVGEKIEAIEAPELEAVETLADEGGGQVEMEVMDDVDGEHVDSTVGLQQSMADTKVSGSIGDQEQAYFQAIANDVDEEVVGIEAEEPTERSATVDGEGEHDLLSQFQYDADGEKRMVLSEHRKTLDQYFEDFEDAGLSDKDASHSPVSTGQSSPSSTQTHTNVNGPKRGSLHAWGVEPPLKSSFSTLAKLNRQYHSFARCYSTVSREPETQHAHQRTSSFAQSKVVDPALLLSTVGDFLGTSDDFVSAPRMRAMMRADSIAHRASRQLEQALANGTLTEEECARLENVISRNERYIAKKLAAQSARDLRRMLDQGRVDARRAQWLESSIEKGQVVLLEEAKQVRSLLDAGKIGTERFEWVKARMQRQHQLLNIEVMRLRQMVDEEADEGGG